MNLLERAVSSKVEATVFSMEGETVRSVEFFAVVGALFTAEVDVCTLTAALSNFNWEDRRVGE